MRSLTFVIISLAFAFSSTKAIAADSFAVGQVLDYDSGMPLANVPVLVGTALVTEDRVPAELPRGVSETMTDSNGRFSLPARPGLVYLELLPTDGHLSAHAVVDTRTQHAPYRLSRPTAGELAWLAQLNADRALNGVPGRVVIDELVEETARYRAQSMAFNGIFEHADAFVHYQSIGGIYPPGPSSAAENIGVISTPSSWREVQQLFMPETYSHGETGHYRAIGDPRVVWAGVAVATRGKPPSFGSGPVDYYAQVFVNRP